MDSNLYENTTLHEGLVKMHMSIEQTSATSSKLDRNSDVPPATKVQGLHIYKCDV